MGIFRRRRSSGQVVVTDSTVAGHVLSVGDVAGDVRIDLSERRYLYWVNPYPAPAALTRAAAQTQPTLALHPRYAVVPVCGRDVEVDRFQEWLDGPDPLAAWLIHAEGGHGKTRLAQHFHRTATRQGWATQQIVPAHDGGDASATIETNGPGVLLILDDAHRWPLTTLEAVAVNLSALTVKRTGVRIRLLMLARTTGTWWPTLATQFRDRGVPETATVLAPLGSRLDRAQVFDDAFTAFRNLLYPPPPPQVRRRDPADFRTGLDLAGPRYNSVLKIHLTALGIVHARTLADQSTAGVEAMTVYLLDNETAEWTKRHATGLATPPETMRQLVTLAVLTQGLPRERARTLLTVVGLAGDDPAADALLRDHAACYPATLTALTPLQPDTLAEDFLALTTPGRPDTPSPLPVDDWTIDAVHRALTHPPTDPPPAWTGAILSTLVETATRWPHITTTLINPVLDTDPLLASTTNATTLTRLTALPGINIPVLRALHQHLTDHPGITAAAIPALETALLPADIAATTDPAHQAELYMRYTGLLAARQHRQQACETAEHAVALYRGLADTDPTTYQSNFAHALETLATWLGEAGHRAEAVEPAREAVTLYRGLTDTDPTTHQPHLAHALETLATWLGEAGHRAEAVEPAREAVTLYRSLTETDPTTHQFDLAHALETLAIRLGRAGYWAEAVEPAREAVTLYRGLTETDPTAHRYYLAHALIILATRLGEAGYWAEAVEPAREAVTLYRGLTETDPTAHRYYLAQSLSTLAFVSVVGTEQQIRQGLEAANAAIALYAQLSEQLPAVYRPFLAQARERRAQLLARLAKPTTDSDPTTSQ